MRRDEQPPVRQPRFKDTEQSFAFRRSRTITGSASSSVRAAGEERGQLQSSRLHEHTLRKHRRRLGVYLLLALVVATGLFYAVTSYLGGTVYYTLTSAQAVSKSLDEARYNKIIGEYFQDHPFEQFAFSLHEDSFEHYFLAKASEVSGAQLEDANGIGNASLTLTLREPIATWTIQGRQYFVDKTGSSFTDNYFATPTIVVSDKSGVSSSAGAIASTKLLRFIGRVTTIVSQSAIPKVASVELPANSTRQVDFRLTGLPYYIKAHLDRDPAGQAADIVSAVAYVEAHGIKPVYIDVRVPSKAFYRDTP